PSILDGSERAWPRFAPQEGGQFGSEYAQSRLALLKDFCRTGAALVVFGKEHQAAAKHLGCLGETTLRQQYPPEIVMAGKILRVECDSLLKSSDRLVGAIHIA